MKKIALFFVICLACLQSVCASSVLSVGDLTCEYKKNPISIAITNPRLSWKIFSEKIDVSQQAYEIRIAREEKDLKSSTHLLWTSGKVMSDKNVLIPYAGPKLKSGDKVYWTVRIWDQNNHCSGWTHAASWEMGLLNPSDWSGASWISLPETGDVVSSRPAQYYRDEFRLEKKVAKARAYVSSMGVYDLFLNGKKVSNDIFAPGFTSYENRIQYQTYDVTTMLNSTNAVGAMVGDGWYRGRLGWQDQRAFYGNKIGFIMVLKITFTDGSHKIVMTNHKWRASYGPIIWSDFYDGECYDYNKELGNWNEIGYEDSKWSNVTLLQQPTQKLVASEDAMPTVTEVIKPVKIFKTPKNELVANLGQNIVGWARVRVKGQPGDTITIKFAELLDPEGNFYTANLRTAKATDLFVLKDDQEHILEPHFTFHGFQYIKIEGLRSTPQLSDVEGIVIHTPMTQTGTFECSNVLLNQLQSNITWGQRDNFLDIPTDCPQRDERLGWTGDAQVFSMTAAYNYDVANFYTKWLRDLALDQYESGRVPNVVPDVLKKGGGSAAWGDAAVIVPWTVYRVYGDKRILEQQFESMKKWVEFLKHQAGANYLVQRGFHFGDWLAFSSDRSDYPGATTEKDLIATAYFRYSSHLLAKVAKIIGKDDEATYWNELSEKVKKAFIHEFVTPSGRLVSHTQTAYLLALNFDLLPKELRINAGRYLAKDVDKFKHLTTGFVGTPLLCSTLSDIGRDDLAFMLLMRKKYPSWLYPVTKGATTIWERWNGIKPDGTLQSLGMNSYNHYSYGAVGEWMYNYIVGIKNSEDYPGYKKFILSPHVGGGLSYAKGSLETMYGRIVSDWKLNGNQFIYHVEIPANTSAEIYLPGKDVFTVPSGNYDFTVDHLKKSSK